MKQQIGFTLIELMITVAIVSILAAVAIPVYQDYTRKARFTEVVSAATPFKAAVATCAYLTGALIDCGNGSNGVPAAAGAAGQVASVTVSPAGAITATPAEKNGIVAEDTYLLIPNLTNSGAITWAIEGGCLAKGLCSK